MVQVGAAGGGPPDEPSDGDQETEGPLEERMIAEMILNVPR